MNDKLDLLDNTTAKVIYYSCLSEPRTLTEISTIWEYQSTNYFYQKSQRKLLGAMNEAGLISNSLTRRGDIISNFKHVMNDDSIEPFFAELNVTLVKDVIENRYGDRFTAEVLNDKTFVEYLISREEGLSTILSKLMYNENEINLMKSIFNHELFKKLFYDALFLKCVFEKRENLPDDFVRFSYDLLIAILDDYDMVKTENYVDEGEYDEELITPSLMPLMFNFLYLDDKCYKILNETMEWIQYNDEELNDLMTKLISIHNIMINKASVFKDEDIAERPHLKIFMNNLITKTEL